MTIRVGTCAWHDHEGFYPRGLASSDRLSFYSRAFDLVEVDATYYGLPRPQTVEGWVRRTPPGFVMDVKAERRMTGHDRTLGLEGRISACREFAERLSPLRDAGRMGHVLLQFPPWLTRSPQAFEELVALREALHDFSLSVEMRHRSWYRGDDGEELLTALERMRMAHVVADEPQVGEGSVPLVARVASETAILRLHGRNASTWYLRGGSSQERFFYLYGEEELQILAHVARTLAEQAKEVHVLTNNNYRDFAVRNALRLRDILDAGPEPREPTLFP